MVHFSHVPQGKEIQSLLLSLNRYLSDTYYVQGNAKQANPSGVCTRSFIFFCAFTNKYLKQLNENCHHYFDKPQKKFNHLLLRINMTQGFQDPKFSKECYKLTGSSFSAWSDMSYRERHVNLEVKSLVSDSSILAGRAPWLKKAGYIFHESIVNYSLNWLHGCDSQCLEYSPNNWLWGKHKSLLFFTNTHLLAICHSNWQRTCRSEKGHFWDSEKKKKQ